jgi:peptidoglycan/LPS O-acetylase OafA/YrhL
MSTFATGFQFPLPAVVAGQRYHLGVNGLRGIMSTHVVLVHFLMAFLPSTLTSFDAVMFPAEASPHWLVPLLNLPVLSLLISGHFSLTNLFVMSGYVLTIPYFHGRPERLSVTLWGRYIRLTVPMALSIALSLLLFRLGLYFNHEAAAISKSLALQVLLPPNELTFWRALKEMTYYVQLTGLSFFNVPLWSIKYEFVGTLVVLPLYLCMPRRWRIIPLLSVAFIVCFAFDATSIFIIGILAGSLLNMVTIPRRLLPVLFVVGLYFGTYIPGHAEYSWLPVIFTDPKEAFFNVSFYNTIGSLCLVAAIAGGFGERFLSLKFLQWLGGIAYSMYLLHLLVLGSLASFLYLVLPKQDIFLLLNFALYYAVIVIVSTPYAKYIDQPAILWGRRFGVWLGTPAAASNLAAPVGGEATGVAARSAAAD